MRKRELSSDLVKVMQRYRICNHLHIDRAVDDCIEELRRLKSKRSCGGCGKEGKHYNLRTRSEFLDSLDRYQHRPWWRRVFNI